jgi:hypothetical protein
MKRFRRSVVAAALAMMLALATGALMLLAATPATATPGPDNAREYWFDNWQITQLWAQGARGAGITIAEIDTGVNADIPEIAGVTGIARAPRFYPNDASTAALGATTEDPSAGPNKFTMTMAF